MATVLASTKADFFRAYSFDFRPREPLLAEFSRLVESKNWQKGSKSKKFESAWSRCFDAKIPADDRVDGGGITIEDGNLSSLTSGMQKLNTVNKGLKVRDIEPEFNSYYGRDDSVKTKWQALCLDCGVEPAASISKCKKVLKTININIFDLLEAKRRGAQPRRFPSRKNLAEYMTTHPETKYPLHRAKQNRFLSILLIQCW